MKNIFKLLMITLLVGTAVSCSDSEAVIDQVLDNVDSESGAIIRTVVAPPELVSLTNETNNIDKIIKYDNFTFSLNNKFFDTSLERKTNKILLKNKIQYLLLKKI